MRQHFNENPLDVASDLLAFETLMPHLEDLVMCIMAVKSITLLITDYSDSHQPLGLGKPMTSIIYPSGKFEIGAITRRELSSYFQTLIRLMGRLDSAGKHIGKVVVDTKAFSRMPITTHCLGRRTVRDFHDPFTPPLPLLQLEPCLYLRCVHGTSAGCCNLRRASSLEAWPLCCFHSHIN